MDKFKRASKQHTVYRQKDGKRVPGITGITKYLTNTQVLIQWANKLGLEGVKSSEYVDQLANIGTCLHYLIECDLQAMEPSLGDFTGNQIAQAKQMFTKFEEWKKGRELVTIAMEKPLVSEAYPFGGTGDWYGIEDGKLTYIDFKTSKGCYFEHKVQAVACSKLWEENTGELPSVVKILRVGRSMDEGVEEIVVPEEYRNDMWQIFTSLCRVHDLKEKLDPSYNKNQYKSWRKK